MRIFVKGVIELDAIDKRGGGRRLAWEYRPFTACVEVGTHLGVVKTSRRTLRIVAAVGREFDIVETYSLPDCTQSRS